MTFEEESIKFLEDHIDNSFAHIMGNQLMDNLEWLEQPEYRPFAYMCDHDEKPSNLICLFPPFIPSKGWKTSRSVESYKNSLDKNEKPCIINYEYSKSGDYSK